METNIKVITDKQGDTFIHGFGRYTDKEPAILESHLTQLMKNYESCFGEIPTAEQLNMATNFSYMLLSEIGECYPTTIYAEAASRLSAIIDEDGLATCENLADLHKFKKN